MKKLILSFFLCSCFFLYSTAQSLTPVVIANGGGFEASGGSTLSFTIGEIVITTFAQSSNILTQGFQQPSDSDNVSGTLGIAEVNANEWKIIAYPNPTSGVINIDISSLKPGTIHFALVDLLGRTRFISESQNVISGDDKFNINLSSFSSGIYFLRFFNGEQDAGEIKVSKIQ